MARKECSHALDRLVTHFVAVGQTCSPCHSAANALLARFLRRQAAFAMLLAQF
jgi:bacterioferritin-associated ferredoxin